MADFSSIFLWWLTILVIGSVFLPLSTKIFSKFFDRGYLFSKVLGIILSSYAVWLLASTKTLPFDKLTIIVVLAVGLLANIIFNNKFKQENENEKLPWKMIFFEEALFFITIVFWSYIRAAEPSIRGLEKFMDFGFVNSILRAQYFPPLDMWLTKSPDYTGGFFINYYYYGHYINAFLTKLSCLDSTVTYNLMMSTLFAFTFCLPFSLGANLYYLLHKSTFSKKIFLQFDTFKLKFTLIIVGLLTGFIVALGGNLHTIYVFTNGYPNESPVPFWQLEPGPHPERYWYPNATRFIPFTIHEFPVYSYVVADLHGHVSDIPMVMLLLAILLTLTVSAKKETDEEPDEKNQVNNLTKNTGVLGDIFDEFKKHTSVPLPMVFLLGLLLSVMYMTNAWDGMIYLITASVVIFFRNLRVVRQRQMGFPIFTAIYKTFSALLFLFFFFLVLSLPFSFNFRLISSQVGVLCAPDWLVKIGNIGPLLFEKDKCQKSPIYMLTILWGFFYFNVFAYLLLSVFPKIKNAHSAFRNKILPSKNKKIVNATRIGFVKKLLTAPYDFKETDIFVLILIFISTLLLIFPEFFYMKDIYPAHYRANTMFKLGYQAFMMLGIVSIYVVFILKKEVGQNRRNIFYVFYRSLFIVLFTLVAIYPYFAISSYYNGLKVNHGLYGLNWMQTQYPDDFKAVVWIRENINCDGAKSKCNNQPVIVEANGESYTDYARVSANTGLPTIVGWPVHEWLWRGSYDEAGKRIPEVATIYESQDLVETKNILKKYNAEYIFVGTLEREKYKNINEEKLNKLGKVVYESGTTRIIKVDMDNIPNFLAPISSPTPTGITKRY
jgi:YYY domain-containing protein